MIRPSLRILPEKFSDHFFACLTLRRFHHKPFEFDFISNDLQSVNLKEYGGNQCGNALIPIVESMIFHQMEQLGCRDLVSVFVEAFRERA